MNTKQIIQSKTFEKYNFAPEMHSILGMTDIFLKHSIAVFFWSLECMISDNLIVICIAALKVS